MKNRQRQGNAWSQIEQERTEIAIQEGARLSYREMRGPAARSRRAAERAAASTGDRDSLRLRDGEVDPALYDENELRRPRQASR